MNVNGVNNNKVLNIYNYHKNNIQNKSVNTKKDSVQISNIGKSLSSYASDESFVNSKEKIEEIRKQISSGTYKRDSKLVAQKMIEAMKRK